MSDSFEPFTEKGSSAGIYGSVRDPKVKVYQKEMKLGAFFHERFLDDAERVEYLVDEERGRVGLRPIGENEIVPHAYSVSNHSLRTINLWKTMNISIEDSQLVTVDTESEEFPVLDVSGLIGGETETDSFNGSDTDNEDHAAESGVVENAYREQEGEQGDHDGDGPGLGALLEIDGVGESKVDALRDDGFETLCGVREAKVSEVAQKGVISDSYASRMTDYAVDILEDNSSDSDRDETDETTRGTDSGEKSSEASSKSNGGLEPLHPGDVEAALAKQDVSSDIDVADVVQAVDSSSQFYHVGRDLGIDRPTAQVLVSSLGLKDALDSGEGLTAQRLHLATEENGGGSA